MALIHADNFNIYGTDITELTASGRYAQSGGDSTMNLLADPDGVSTELVLRTDGNTTLRKALETPTTKVGICGRFYCSSLPSDDGMLPTLFEWADASNISMARVRVRTTGAMSFEIWDTVLGNWYTIETTTGPVITSGAWWHVAAQLDLSGSGAFELRVEGVTQIDNDSTAWGGHLHNGPTVYQVRFSNEDNTIGATTFVYLKDYVMWDGLGTQNTSFPGSVIVSQLNPTADNDIGYWVPSTGTAAWSILDNNPALTPYVSGGDPVGDPLIMDQSNLPADVTSVKGVITLVRAAKVDGGDGQLQVSLLSNGVASDGEDRPITAAQTYWQDVHELDPDTAAPWLPTAVDASLFQINRTV